ncbi:MAG: Rrf2 family transcriptional regulator [Nocardiaceae bacterium]|nr:Rrf2 family transcriptional regulator [Nocardiaceae bacterium]
MRLTSHTDYAFRTLLHLAVKPDRRATVREVADAYGLSRNHLAKVAQRLTRAGLVESAQGRSGGLTLVADPHRLSVGDIVRAAEDDFAIVECLGEDNTCRVSGVCAAHGAFARARSAFFAELDRQTLAQAAVNELGIRRNLGIEVVS